MDFRRRSRRHRILLAVSLATPILAAAGIFFSHRLRTWTTELVETPADVKHRKAVLAARSGEYEEAERLFEAALAGSDARPEVWVDYVRALSWAERHDQVLRVYPRLPADARSHPEVLGALARASLAQGDHAKLVDAVAAALEEAHGGSSKPFREYLATGHITRARGLLRKYLSARAEATLWAEPLLVESLRRDAVARARAGDPRAALPVLEALVEDPVSSPAVLADLLTVLCWAGSADEAVKLLASTPSSHLDLPEYAIAAIARAWRDAPQSHLPDDLLARALTVAREQPALAEGLVDGCASAEMLRAARQASTESDPGAELRARIDYRLAVLLARAGQTSEALGLLAPLADLPLPFAAALRADYITILSWAGRDAEAVRVAQHLRTADAPLPAYTMTALNRSYAALEQQRRPRADLTHQRAVALGRAGKFDEALQEIDIAIRQTPRLAAAQADRVVLLAWAGRYGPAVEAFERLPADLPKPAYLLATAASSYRALGKLDRAIELGRAALAKDPNHRAALDGLFAALLDANRSEDARLLLDDQERQGRSLGAYRAQLAHREAVDRARAGDAEAALAMLDRAAAITAASSGTGGTADNSAGADASAWDRVAVSNWAGRHWEAIEAFEALKAPESPPDYVRREAAEAYAATYRPRAALQLLAGILAEAPGDERAARRIRELLLANRRRLLDPALTRFARRGARTPAWLREYVWAEPALDRAFALARSGDESSALVALRDGLADRAGSGSGRWMADALVLLYLSGRNEEVVALSRAVAPQHTGPEWRVVFAAQAALGDAEAAQGAAWRWCQHRPADPGACSAVVQQLLARGRYDEAHEASRGLPPLDRARAEGDVHLHRGEIFSAARAYAEHLKAAPKDAEATLALAIARELARRSGDADALASEALARIEPADYTALRAVTPAEGLALGQILRRLGRPDDAFPVLAAAVEARPESVDARWELAQVLEAQRARLAALEQYDAILRRAPGDARASAARAQLLLGLQALSPVAADRQAQAQSAGVARTIDRAVAQLEAVQAWRTESAEGGPPVASAAVESGAVVATAPQRDEQALPRATLAAIARAEDGHLQYEATLLAAAEAHASLGEYGPALERYDRLVDMVVARGGRGSTTYSDARLEQVRCLTHLMRFGQAGAILDQLEVEVPAVRTYRGFHVPNRMRVEVTAERGWWLVAQERLDAAERHFGGMLQSAPRSSEARFGLAHTHLIQGRLRQGLREFQEAVALHPEDTELRAGLAHALLLNGHQAEAEQLATALVAESPNESHVRELARELHLANAPELSARTSADSGRASADGVEAELGLQVPISGQGLALFGGAGWKRERTELGSAERRRATVGAVIAPLTGFSLRAEASADPGARSWRAAGGLLFAPSDRVSLGLSADSDTWSLPPGALRAHVLGRLVETTAGYRIDETFESELRAHALALSDGNRIDGGGARAQLQVYANGVWRGTIGVDANLDHSTGRDLTYYSPTLLWSAALTPGLEHVWTRSTRYSLRDRLTVETGFNHESRYGYSGLWGVGYSQTHLVSDVADVRLELGLTRRRYGDDWELGWQVGVGSGVRF